jgi:two-component system NtrC family sensor kinase
MDTTSSPKHRPAAQDALTIMVIEDDGQQREAMKQQLESRATRVVCCASALCALEQLRRGATPDLIVLDLIMPEMDGWQFRLEQKKEPSWATIPVIAISDDHSAQAAVMDVSAHLTKPIDGDVLVETVDRLISDLERNRALARASEHQRLISLGALLGGIAHEVNNPLAFVFGSIDLLQRQLTSMTRPGTVPDPFSVATALRALDRAKQGAERIAAVVRSASMFASADLETIETIDIHAVLESSVQVASNEIRHGAHLVRSFTDVPRVRGNPAKLGQVFLNLLLNAVYAIRDSGGRDQVIRLATSSQDQYVVVSVSDSASLMEPSALACMYEPAAAVHGTGTRLHLGLAVSREIVMSMGGSIEVEPAQPQGATFRVLLPGDSRASYPAPPPKPPTKVHAAREPILIVDDEPLMCELLAATLSDDYSVTAFTSARAALAALQENDYDVILCDVMMPELNGMDLYELAILDRPELGERFVFITGGAFTERARLFLRQTGRPVVKKPCSRKELLEVIGRVLAPAATSE